MFEKFFSNTPEAEEPKAAPEKRRFSVNEDEIRAEGKKKGWSDSEIDAKIAAEKLKIEAANRKVELDDMSERAVSSLEQEFQNRYDNDPEFRKSIDEREKKKEEAA